MNRPVGMVVCSAAALALALAGCGGHGAAPSSLPSLTQRSGGAVGPATFTYGQNVLRDAQLVGPAQGAVLSADVAIRLRDTQGLSAYAREVSDPNAPMYRHFLTPQEIADRFGATSSDYAGAATYFTSYGLQVGGWPQRLMLAVRGSQAQMERAFGTSFGVYRRNGTTFVAPTTVPHFSKPIAVSGVTGIVTLPRLNRNFVPVTGGTAMVNGYFPQQIRNAFDYTGAYKAGYTGTGINVGIIGTGGISQSDLSAYGTMFGVNLAPVTQVSVTAAAVQSTGITGGTSNSGFATPPPVTYPCSGGLPACNPEDGEAQIDTEAAASLAPGANVLFYLGYNPAECFQPGAGAPTAGGVCPSPGPNAGLTSIGALGIQLSDDEIQQAIADDSADVLSISYGAPEQAVAGYYFDANDPTTGFGPAEFAALAAEGIAVFVSSGDAGAEECQRPVYQPAIDNPCVSYPAGDPSVVSVGGTTVPLDQFGRLTNQITGWSQSGGGVSQFFAQPPWQNDIPGAQSGKRNQPDLSLLGDSGTGMATVLNTPFEGPYVSMYGGTSVAAPEMAAMWALVLQACKQSASCAVGTGAHPYRLGNPAALLYSFYAKGSQVNPVYHNVFYDVVYGDNAQPAQSPPPSAPPGAMDPGFSAGPGYDLVTGLGVPFARALIKAVAGR